MRVLLDTNVLIAAFTARGRCAELLEHCARTHDLVTSEALLDELGDKLVHKFRLSPEMTETRVALLRATFRVVAPGPLPAPVCRDPDDDRVLAAAVCGEWGCIVTGDRDLLVIRRYGDVDIVAPGEFAGYEAGP